MRSVADYRNVPPLSATDPVEGQIGGLGINLILGMARQIRYQRIAGSNITEIDL